MKDVLVFGCGAYFMRKMDTINNLYNIVAIIDNMKKGEIQLSNNRKVCILSPQDGLNKYPNAFVIIAVKDFITITNQLIMLDVIPEKIIFSQNLKPFGPESIIFNKDKKVSAEKKTFCYQKKSIR